MRKILAVAALLTGLDAVTFSAPALSVEDDFLRAVATA